MNQSGTARLIKSVMVGARIAIAQEAFARAEWSAACARLPKREPKRNGVKRDAYLAEERVILTAQSALSAAIKRVESYAEPFCKLLSFYDNLTVLPQRIELLSIHPDHMPELNERAGCETGCLWMVANQMEISIADREANKRGGCLGNAGVVYKTLHNFLTAHRGLIENEIVDLDKQFPCGVDLHGVTSWGVANGELAREWVPFRLAEDHEL
ncbi:hypothetical protein PQR34_28975 [Paraburkholderia sediminicola]|uniref:hypothetical protein n=1 Tax=Paraburkholderia sediminicola TaxID=458836 RepID=UPI0038BCF847